MQMAWIPSSSPTSSTEEGRATGRARKESGEEQVWIFHGKFGGPSTETAAKHPGISPQLVPATPCTPLAGSDFPSARVGWSCWLITVTLQIVQQIWGVLALPFPAWLSGRANGGDTSNYQIQPWH